MVKLTDHKKQAILYDALHQEVNKVQLEMPLEEILSCALHIEEAVVNPRQDAEGNSNNILAAKRPKPKFQRNR
jgi:hypothetical protein